MGIFLLSMSKPVCILQALFPLHPVFYYNLQILLKSSPSADDDIDVI